MIMSSSFWDISDLVFDNLVIVNWSADNSVNTNHLEMFLISFERSSQGLSVAIEIVKIGWAFLELWSK